MKQGTNKFEETLIVRRKHNVIVNNQVKLGFRQIGPILWSAENLLQCIAPLENVAKCWLAEMLRPLNTPAYQNADLES